MWFRNFFESQWHECIMIPEWIRGSEKDRYMSESIIKGWPLSRFLEKMLTQLYHLSCQLMIQRDFNSSQTWSHDSYHGSAVYTKSKWCTGLSTKTAIERMIQCPCLSLYEHLDRHDMHLKDVSDKFWWHWASPLLNQLVRLEHFSHMILLCEVEQLLSFVVNPFRFYEHHQNSCDFDRAHTHTSHKGSTAKHEAFLKMPKGLSGAWHLSIEPQDNKNSGLKIWGSTEGKTSLAHKKLFDHFKSPRENIDMSVEDNKRSKYTKVTENIRLLIEGITQNCFLSPKWHLLLLKGKKNAQHAIMIKQA